MATRSSTVGVLSALALVGILGACRDRASSIPPAISRTTTQSAQLRVQNDDTVMRITTRRCEHELACERIGLGRSHGDMADCLQTIGREVRTGVGDAACPNGTEERAVEHCLAELDRDPCGSVLAGHGAAPACSRAVLCWR